MTTAHKRINRKIFFVLLAAGLLGVLAIIPMIFDLLGRGAFRRAPAPELPVTAVVALALVQNGVLLAVVISLGLILAGRIGAQMPLISAWADGGPAPDLKSIAVPGLLLGAFTGAALVAADAVFFLTRLPSEMLLMFHVPQWKRLLAGVVYGGITEELLMRLFLVSLVAWLLGKFFKRPDGMPAPVAFWAAITLVAILFGLGHLPATAAVTPLTPLLVARAAAEWCGRYGLRLPLLAARLGSGYARPHERPSGDAGPRGDAPQGPALISPSRAQRA